MTLQVRDFRLLLITFVIQALGIGAMLAGVDYVARIVLSNPGASSILFACFVGPALLVTPLWQRLAGRVGKKQCYLISSLVLAAGAAGLSVRGYVLTREDVEADGRRTDQAGAAGPAAQ